MFAGFIQRNARSRLAARNRLHLFPIRRALRDAHAEASGTVRVHFSQLLTTVRGSGKLPILFRVVVFLQHILSGTRAQSCITVLNDCLNALNACANKRRTRKAQLDSSYMECINTRGVRVCMSTLHNVGNIPRTTICKSSSGMSIATLAPASIRYTDAFTPTLCTTGGLPRFPNVPTLAVQASSSSRNMPPRSLCSSPTLTYSFRHYCVTPTTDPPSLQERQLSTRPHTLVAILNGQRLAELVALL